MPRAFANEVEIAGEDLRAVAGLHVLSEITEGDSKSVLISEAKTFDADCIFVGSCGSNSRLERHTLGSVSAAVANGAHCSVEVVRATPGANGFPAGHRSGGAHAKGA